jgi:GNAT superfamily N-acetyltransferase
MCDEWMPPLELPLTLEQFHQLPRNSAYKYEYLGGRAYLSPRPKHFHALLDLTAFAEETAELANHTSVRPLTEDDWPCLERPFRTSLSRVQPFASLRGDTLAEATRECLERTRTGRDGPLLPDASFVATEGAERKHIGGILITALPGGDPSDWDSYYWSGPAPAGAVEGRFTQPHLTWIFVFPLEAGRGIGSALLAASVRVLKAEGYHHLWSTFVSGNDSSMLWHWRNGFRLLPYPGSRRRMMEIFRQRGAAGEITDVGFGAHAAPRAGV